MREKKNNKNRENRAKYLDRLGEKVIESTKMKEKVKRKVRQRERM